MYQCLIRPFSCIYEDYTLSRWMSIRVGVVVASEEPAASRLQGCVILSFKQVGNRINGIGLRLLFALFLLVALVLLYYPQIHLTSIHGS